ncbi:metalloprotease family protein [Brassicibacter mesophilus]|uniref:metalloprotease family protein n=1 Tax=Brassicibacter mesophilus TaxID=745119 RepID=UPI003D1B654F
MYLIPGFLISIVTFPGVIVHEIAHQLFCKISRVAVFDVCYFRFGNPSGYVIHEEPKTTKQQILIGIGPFLVNTVIGALISLPAAIPVIKFESGNALEYVLIWLGVSITMHSFPSVGDAKSIWKSVRKKETPILAKIFGTPIVGIIFLCALGSVAWLDLIYGIAVATLIPNLLIKMIA